MERRLIKGETFEENIDSIDLILQAWAPRLGNYIMGVIPPIPILHRQRVPEEDGTILKLLLPFSGKIVAAYISIGKYNVKPVTLDVWSTGAIGFGGARLVCDRPLHTYFTDKWRVTAGCLLEAAIDPPNAIEDINIGILALIDMEHAEKEHQMLEGLRQLEVTKSA